MGWWNEQPRGKTPTQREAARHAEARKREAARHAEARKREARRLAPGPNLIAHCQAFRPITALPWQCPVCQAVVGEEQTE